MSQIGFVGLGAMGLPMASHLIRAGHSLSVFSRRVTSAEPLAAVGATVCASAREVAANSTVVFTMVTDTAAVEEVVLGHDGIANGAKPGTTVVDHSTIAPAAARRIASSLRERGVDMLDAPVSGGVAGAQNATLSIMAGGDTEVFERCRPLLEVLGKTIVHAGPSGAGQLAKACNQILIVVTQLGVAEAVLLAERSGIDFDRIRPALMGGFAASRILEIQSPKMTARDFEGKIESRLHHKDVLIALETARELGLKLPASSLAADALTKLQERGGGRQDSAAVFGILEKL
jgi:2-hydroxy-3-oxopropionate reductase